MNRLLQKPTAIEVIDRSELQQDVDVSFSDVKDAVWAATQNENLTYRMYNKITDDTKDPRNIKGWQVPKEDLVQAMSEVPDYYHKELVKATSPEHFIQLKGQLIEAHDRDVALGKLGLVGSTLVNTGVGVLDPGGAIVGIATGGPVSRAVMSAYKATKAAQRLKLVGATSGAAGGAVGAAATELALSYDNPTRDLEDVLWAASMGAVFGGGAGAYSSRAVAIEQAEIRKAHRQVAQDIETAQENNLPFFKQYDYAADYVTPTDFSKGGSTIDTLLDVDTANGTVKSRFVGGRNVFTRTYQRWFGSHAIVTSNETGDASNAILRRVDDATAGVDQGFASTGITTKVQMVVTQAQNETMMATNLIKDAAAEAGIFFKNSADFKRQLYLQNSGAPSALNDVPGINKLMEAYRHPYTRQREMERQYGLASDSSDIDSYQPQMPKIEKIEQHYADWAKSMEVNFRSLGYEPKLAARMTKGYYDVLRAAKSGIHTGLDDFLRVSPDALQDLMVKAGVKDANLMSEMYGLAKEMEAARSKKASQGSLNKSRTDVDMSIPVGKDGLQLVDFYETDPGLLVTSRVQKGAASVLWSSELNVRSTADLDRLVNDAAKRDGLSVDTTSALYKKLMASYNHNHGYPVDGAYNNTAVGDVMSLSRGAVQAAMLGQVGLTSLVDLGVVIAKHGLKSFIPSGSALDDVIMKAKAGKLTKEEAQLYADVEKIIPHLTNNAELGRFLLNTEADAASPSAKARKAGRLLSEVSSHISGQHYVTNVAKATTMKGIQEDFRRYAKTGVAPTILSDSRLRLDYGLRPEVTEAILENINKHGFKLGHWPKDLARKFTEVSQMMMDDTVINGRVGDKPDYKMNEVGKLFTQFLDYPMVATNKFITKEAKHGVDGVMTKVAVLTGLMSTVALVGRVYLNSLGREDAEEYRERMLTPENIAKFAWTYNALAGFSTQAIDTILDIAGYETQFSRASRDSSSLLDAPAIQYLGALPKALQGLIQLVREGEMSKEQADAVQLALIFTHSTYLLKNLVDMLQEDLEHESITIDLTDKDN